MVRAKLTDRGIQAVKPVAGKRIEVHDEQIPGLVLRITANGRRTWSMVYRRKSDGLKRRLTLGPYPSITLEAARRKAHEIVAAVWDGRDPVGEAKSVRERMTFGKMASLWLERHAKRKLKSAKKVEQVLNLHLLPKWRDRPVEAITRSDVIAVLEEIAAAGKEVTSNRVRSLAAAIFNWAVAEDLVTVNPLIGVRTRGAEVAKERFLSRQEIKAFVDALDRGVMEERATAVLRLCLLTGQRVGEVSGLSLAEIDRHTWTWTLPAQRSKNGGVHLVPLVAQAREIVADWIERAEQGNRSLLFATRTGKAMASSHIGNCLGASREKLGMEAFTIHDLRRTVATHISSMGFDRLTVAALLNHTSTTKAGITGSVYDRHNRLEEKRRALEAWDAEVIRIVSGAADEANVVPLRR